MAAIEGNHLGPVLTHNPPGPPWVMDAGWWCGGLRQGGISLCVWMASGVTSVLPPSLPSLSLMIPSAKLCSGPDTTLTLTPSSLCVSAVCHCATLIMRMQASSTIAVYLQCIIHPLVTFAGLVSGKTLTPTAFTHQDCRIQNQGHWHLGEFHSFQAPCSLDSGSYRRTVQRLMAH